MTFSTPFFQFLIWKFWTRKKKWFLNYLPSRNVYATKNMNNKMGDSLHCYSSDLTCSFRRWNCFHWKWIIDPSRSIDWVVRREKLAQSLEFISNRFFTPDEEVNAKLRICGYNRSMVPTNLEGKVTIKSYKTCFSAPISAGCHPFYKKQGRGSPTK